MTMPLDTDLRGASDSWSTPAHAEDSPAFRPAKEGIRLSDLLNLRVGCWRPAVHIEPCRRFEA
jgi:hypothetical protein